MPSTPRPPLLSRVPTLLLTALAALAVALPAHAQEPNFGRAVVMTGSELLVGQPVNWYGPGAVYQYALNAAGEWERRALFNAPDSSRMDSFGGALAVEGNTLVVGAPAKDDGNGVIYHFRRAAAAAPWEVVGRIVPGVEGDLTGFGSALSLEDGELLVGAPALEGRGAVLRYVLEGESFRPAGRIAPNPGSGVAAFGAALSREGDHLLVGAPASDSARGAAFVARPGDDGSWDDVRPVRLDGPPLSRRAALGAGVLLQDGQAFVGVPGAGEVVVAAPDAAGDWSVADRLRPGDAPERSGFGATVAAVDGEVWVGAPGVDRGNGRVYRFVPGASGGWGDSQAVTPDDPDGTDWPMGFGYAIAGTDGRVAVGMPTRDFGEGRALTLTRSGDGWAQGQVLEGEIYRIGSQLASGDRCRGGEMSEFPCENMELVAHIPTTELGGARGAWVNDVWGWTDPETGRNYALVARRDGASFVDVTNASAPRVVGDLPRTDGSRPSVWRDIKVIGTTAYVVSDGAGDHGMQVFDLTRLRDVPAGGEVPVFEPDYTYTEMASAHNVVADTETGFLYIVGANSGGRTCGGGLHIVDAREPLQPTFAGCYNDPTSPNSRGYTHDAQCLVYRGPDAEYQGREICVGSNESEINIADVTDKSNPTTISRMSYPNVAYAHQGWFDPEQRYFYMNDEGDEVAGLAEFTRTMVWDLTELDDPVLVNQYFGPVRSSDHNLFINGDRMYQANYGSGLRVLDISDRENPREIAFFDSAPYNDNGPGFSSSESGAWSNYPFFEDGLVVFTSVREGLFIMRVMPPVS